MPIARISAEKAVSTRKANAYSRWGDRAISNRIEPITTPYFKVPFKIEPKSKIFTVGSCFARNVETELIKRGFDLPMRNIEVDDSAALNNYGAPSIYNEFAWAFGEQDYNPKEHILEIVPGKFADLHLAPNRRPQPYEKVLALREAILNAYRRAAECPVLIMTLGLVELWFDNMTGYYLNVGPRPSQIQAEPLRFELHVLSFQECYDYLERTIQLLIKHGHPNLQILMTVSPVPLRETHRDEDVIVANMYSKSVLRAVAETLTESHNFVTYYPSYESVMLSDRKRTWMDDMQHVHQEIISLNVSRMIDAFVSNEENCEKWRLQIEEGGSAVAVEKAKTIRSGSREIATLFFDEFGSLSKKIPEFALEHALFLAQIKNYDGVLSLLATNLIDAAELQILLLKSDALINLGHPGEAIALFHMFLESPLATQDKLRSSKFWQAFLHAATTTNDETVVVGTLARVIAESPKYAHWAYAMIGKWFLMRGKLEKAISYLEMAVNVGEDGNSAYIYLAEAFSAMGNKHDARIALSKLKSANKSPTSRAEQLKAIIK